MRRGMMLGSGKRGYYNIIGRDPYVHSQSARGMKQPQRAMSNYAPRHFPETKQAIKIGRVLDVRSNPRFNVYKYKSGLVIGGKRCSHVFDDSVGYGVHCVKCGFMPEKSQGLPTLTYRGKVYYVDFRLGELRNVRTAELIRFTDIGGDVNDPIRHKLRALRFQTYANEYIAGVDDVHGELQKGGKLDISKYQGKWYQQGGTPAWFQQGCSDSTAEYTDKKDYLEVKNSCMKEGRKSISIGKAYRKGDNKLEVDFVGGRIFTGDYNIVHIDKNYRNAIVSSDGKIWILSRAKRIPEKEYGNLLQIAKNKGYNVSKIKRGGKCSPSDLKYGTAPDSQFDAKSLKAGIKVELEHTNSRAVAKAIAKAHLKESPKYYVELAKMEKKLGGKVPFPHDDIKVANLPIENAVYVPSTDKSQKQIPEREFKARVKETEDKLTELFNGFTRFNDYGGYKSEEQKRIIKERGARVASFASIEDATDPQKLSELKAWLLSKQKEWGQESIGYENEGDLHYLSA